MLDRYSRINPQRSAGAVGLHRDPGLGNGAIAEESGSVYSPWCGRAE